MSPIATPRTLGSLAPWRFLPCLLALVALSAPGVVFAAEKDRIERKNGSPAVGWVVRESTDFVWYAQSKDAKPQSLRQSDVTRIVFNFQVADGFWSKAVESRDRGQYAKAAEDFAALADGGQSEPEIVYGAFASAEMWEQAGRYDLAAKQYARIAETYGPKFALPEPGKPPVKPKDEELPHRLWLDARARQGMDLALSKDAAGATKIADELAERGKILNQPDIDSRAAMVRAAIAAVAGDKDKFNEQSKRVAVLPGDPAGLHFNRWRAEQLRSQGDAKGAAAIYRNLLAAVGDDAALASQIRLGLGLTLVDSEPQSALQEFVFLDALPSGSPDQKCIARWHVGRLLAESAKQQLTAAGDDPAKKKSAEDLLAAAKLVISAAAGADSTREEKGKAKALLDQLGGLGDQPVTPGAAAPAGGATAGALSGPGAKPAVPAGQKAAPAAQGSATAAQPGAGQGAAKPAAAPAAPAGQGAPAPAAPAPKPAAPAAPKP
ncbi:hypothetical protein LBMAG53_10870 [Planctomycetota bacterium]|nr:hypothetical protein LBMAG53_10870 [Planctomycetota bacterium]